MSGQDRYELRRTLQLRIKKLSKTSQQLKLFGSVKIIKRIDKFVMEAFECLVVFFLLLMKGFVVVKGTRASFRCTSADQNNVDLKKTGNSGSAVKQ